jgi:type I restriction enzyme M protein
MKYFEVQRVKQACEHLGDFNSAWVIVPLVLASNGVNSRTLVNVDDAMSPQPKMTICDPACGTGGFLLAAHDYIAKTPGLDKEQKKRLKSGTLHGVELVDSVARLCAMNLLLHGIGESANGDDLPVTVRDALAGKHGEFDMVLANPPFGKKSSVTIVNDAGEQQKESLVINRDDFWASTSNKQLNFLQHIFTILKQHGRAAVVLPDNVLFEGGAGETIRRELLKQADVHTLLRLPTGIFYAQGVKANVLFFDRKPAQEKPWTEKLPKRLPTTSKPPWNSSLRLPRI